MEALGLGYNRECGQQRSLEIVLDTNFVVILSEHPHLISQLESITEYPSKCVLLSVVLRELETVSRQLGSTKRRLLERVLDHLKHRCSVVDFETAPDVDQAIIEYASGRGCLVAVATNDRELRRRLREAGIPSIYFREESRRLEYEGLLP
ncbi:PIN domain-containing protein [Thermogladius sp.]|uniref:PIN domain-containing protein n=1 Tax=Thermogladius sp. TaxID=2023064 RepID=UPI003D122B8C